MADASGLSVRVLNPARGTFHPKLYLARRGDQLAAAIGSANLTSGLVANVEAVAVISGHRDSRPLARLWEVAESWWGHEDAIDWAPGRVAVASEVLEPELLAAIRAAVARQGEIRTLGDGKPNWVRDVTRDGVWVETLRSRERGRPPQLVEAWMIQVAWGLDDGARDADEPLPARRGRPEREALELRLRAARAAARGARRLAPADRLALER